MNGATPTDVLDASIGTHKESKSNKSSKLCKKTKNLSIDLTDGCSPMIQQKLMNCPNKVNVDALHQELYLDLLKSREVKDPDP